MKPRTVFRIGVILLFTSVLAAGVMAAAVPYSDLPGRFSGVPDWSAGSAGLDKTSLISTWKAPASDLRSSLISDMLIMPGSDTARYAQQQGPISWDPSFMSRVERNNNRVTHCRLL